MIKIQAMPYSRELERELTAGSGAWSFEPAVARLARPRAGLPTSVLSLVLAVSPLTLAPDPWVMDRRNESQPTSFLGIGSTGRRRVSRHEARQSALRFMEQMEAARVRAALEEAQRAFGVEEIG